MGINTSDDSALLRTIECVNYVATLQRDGALDDEAMAKELSASERSFFSDPSPEDLEEWNAFWFSTPLPQRHSPSMPMPGWTFGSMVESIADAEFEISGVVTERGRCYLTFEPSSYPYGGAGCLVALLECLGNTVLAVNDGTGVIPHVRGPRWEPKRHAEGAPSVQDKVVESAIDDLAKNPPDPDEPRASVNAGGALICIAFGLYLLAGAARAFTGTWPFFLPPQLDGIAALLSGLPDPYGTYAAGGVVGLLGIGAVAGGIALWTRPAVRTEKDAPHA